MPDDAGDDFSQAQEEAKEEAEAASERRKPLSLAPLTFDEAISGLLQVKLSPEELRPKMGKRPVRGR